jgi:HEAT repeat protein
MAKVVRGPGHELDRDHSMAPPIAGPDQVPAACVSCHAGAKNASRIAEAWKRNVPGPAAKRRQAIVAAIDDDAAGRKSAPAGLARLAGDPERSWFVRWAALQKLGMGRPAQVTGDAADAIRLAVTDPNPAVRRAAARALGILGAPNDAETLQHLTDDADPWTALEAARAMGQLGIPTAGARLLQLLKRPDLIAEARAQYVYGHACLVGQDMKHAESALRRALLLNPLMVGALNDLGLALVGLNQKDAAIAAWKHALDINPRFSAARRNLESAASK